MEHLAFGEKMALKSVLLVNRKSEVYNCFLIIYWKQTCDDYL